MSILSISWEKDLQMKLLRIKQKQDYTNLSQLFKNKGSSKKLTSFRLQIPTYRVQRTLRTPLGLWRPLNLHLVLSSNLNLLDTQHKPKQGDKGLNLQIYSQLRSNGSNGIQMLTWLNSSIAGKFLTALYKKVHWRQKSEHFHSVEPRTNVYQTLGAKN